MVRGLGLVGRDADAGVVDCRAGTLALDRAEVRAHNGVCVHARPRTSVLLTASRFRFGRAVFAGSSGHVERCRFAGAADNAIAVIEGARVTVPGSRIDGSRIHGVRVSDAWARLTGDREREDAGTAAQEVLTQITGPQSPEPGRLRRAVTMLEGALAPVATGLAAGTAVGAQEWAQSATRSLTGLVRAGARCRAGGASAGL
ncbi:hypothetical protein [Streptomyces sp. NBC_01235]|uniref:hypothetical protein n=1 Tax=Streptomyces sp. NBC_01235 TaxID=2903788 RepID=UPI002E11838C|nr:hypothetical protein OG289_41025 [Streptomyces sp. NBC_01235]